MSVRRVGVLFVSFALLTSGCGKKGRMFYPDMLVAKPPQQVTVEQSGAALRLSFDLPTSDLAGRKLEDLEAVQISRRVYKDKDCVSCQDQYQDVQKVAIAFPAPAQRQGNRIIWSDSDVRRGERYQYRLKAVQKGGGTGSAVITALVGIQPSPPPPAVKVRAVFGGQIVIELAGTPPQGTSLAGYYLYRADGTAPMQLLASLTAGTSRYEDQMVRQGVVYRYGARMLVKRNDGIVAESESSEPVAISVADDPK